MENVMPREQTPLRPIKVDYRCDSCQRGHYRPTGMTLTSYPAKYPHACDQCVARRTFSECYPLIRYTFEGGQLNLSDDYKELDGRPMPSPGPIIMEATMGPDDYVICRNTKATDAHEAAHELDNQVDALRVALRNILEVSRIALLQHEEERTASIPIPDFLRKGDK